MDKEKGTTKVTSAVMDAVVGDLAELLMSASPDLGAPHIKALYKLGDASVGGKMILQSHGKEFFTRLGKENFTCLGKENFT